MCTEEKAREPQATKTTWQHRFRCGVRALRRVPLETEETDAALRASHRDCLPHDPKVSESEGSCMRAHNSREEL